MTEHEAYEIGFFRQHPHGEVERYATGILTRTAGGWLDDTGSTASEIGDVPLADTGAWDGPVTVIVSDRTGAVRFVVMHAPPDTD